MIKFPTFNTWPPQNQHFKVQPLLSIVLACKTYNEVKIACILVGSHLGHHLHFDGVLESSVWLWQRRFYWSHHTLWWQLQRLYNKAGLMMHIFLALLYPYKPPKYSVILVCPCKGSYYQQPPMFCKRVSLRSRPMIFFGFSSQVAGCERMFLSIFDILGNQTLTCFIRHHIKESLSLKLTKFSDYDCHGNNN